MDYLLSTGDPRLGVIAVKYEFPANPLATAGAEDVTPADQQGMPFGYSEATIARIRIIPENQALHGNIHS